MEGLFCAFSDFFTQPDRPAQRERHDPPQDGQKIGQTIAQFEDPTAEQQKVQYRSSQYADYKIDPHLSIARCNGIDKQGHRHRQPEQQIQQPAQQRQANANP